MKLQIKKSLKEDALIRGCLKRDRKAQRQLYEHYASGMLGLCVRYVGDIQEAEDIMIGGFMRIYEKMDQYEGKGSFEGWMKRIMINESLGFIRRNKSMYITEDIEEVAYKIKYEMLQDTLEAQDLLRLINELPSGYRAVFNLYAIEGYTHKEIGELLGISENTSKSQLSRARAHLQKKLKEMELEMNKKNVDHEKQ
jgi:RNA polymerase sigma-70 factor (ECF subfamily)